MDKPIFVDNHVLVALKTAGQLTQPNESDDVSLEEEAKRWVKRHFQKPGAVFLHAIHRLDRGVSGLVLFARTSKALSRLGEQMREKKIGRTYFALVEGTPNKSAHLKTPLLRKEFHSMVDPAGKMAELYYEVVEERGECSLLKVRLVTGRYHQIRAQLSHIGHPIVGDEKYGSHMRFRGGAIALHHGELTFDHPVTKERLKFEELAGKGFA